MKAYSVIQFSLADEILREVVDEDIVTDLWIKLERVYMTKSLTNNYFEAAPLHPLR